MNSRVICGIIYNSIFKNCKINDTIFVECFYGMEFSGDAKYFTKEFTKYKKKTVYVAYNNKITKDDIINNGFTPVKFLSSKYFKYIYSSQYIVTNLNLYKLIVPHKKQYVIQTWHGFPLKQMVKNIANSVEANRQYDEFSEDLKKWTHLLSSSEYYLSILKDSFGLTNNITILSGSMPRINFLKNSSDSEIQKAREKFKLSTKKIILYCPTWKSYEAHEEINLLELNHELPEYEIIVKLHPHDITSKNKYISMGVNVFYNIDIYELLIVTDILITDFSSIALDFLSISEKVIFHSNQMEKYSKEVGLLIKPECLGNFFIKHYTINELVRVIKTNMYGSKNSFVKENLENKNTINYSILDKEIL